MKILDWTIRTGPVDYAYPYDASRVKVVDGYHRLSLNSNPMSAGLLGPIVEPGIYKFWTRGRFDSTDPAPVFSIYTYKDTTAEEQDWIEVDRQRDPNNPNSLIISVFSTGGVLAYRKTSIVRAFNRYLLTVDVSTQTTVSLEGIFPNGTSIYVATSVGLPFPAGHQLRIGFWIPKSGYVFADSNSRGPRVIDVRGTFEPHA